MNIDLKNIDNDSLYSEILRRYKCLKRPFGSALFLGGQNTGKTTHSKEISELNCWCYINPSDLFYSQSAPTEKSDEHIVKSVLNKIKQPICAHGAVFDSFPQNLNQTLLFEKGLLSEGVKIDRVVELNHNAENSSNNKNEVLEYYKIQGKVISFNTNKDKEYVSSQLRSLFSKGIYNQSQ